mgnify:CR=1 FL=1
MNLEDILPGQKTKLGALLVFVGGGLQALGLSEIGKFLFDAGIALGFVGLRFQK